MGGLHGLDAYPRRSIRPVAQAGLQGDRSSGDGEELIRLGLGQFCLSQKGVQKPHLSLQLHLYPLQGIDSRLQGGMGGEELAQ